MKRQLAFGLSLGIVLGVLSPLFVAAQGAAPVPSDSKSELTARIEARKAKFQTRLNNEEATRISGRCNGAQQKFAGIGKKFTENDTPLRTKYEAYIKRIQDVTQKAEAKGVDTAELKKNTDTFNQKYQAMIAAINEFNVSISDLQSIDCKANPTGFKASLDSARASLAEVQAARAELQKIAKGPLQNSFKALKIAIAKEKS